MCGIVGAITLNNPRLPFSEEAALRALALISYRGPDDSGVWWSDNRSVFLGHQRLSIIDLSSNGHQPMSNEDGSIWIIYNGESYNYHTLQSELQAKGHQFRSNTDTEVIVHGYEEYGVDIIHRLRGMFVFALYDMKRNYLLLARDRMGIKPLYHTWVGNSLIFSSEIKSLLEFPGVERCIDRDSLCEYLAFGKVYTPKTMFKDIYKFPAAHYATFCSEDGLKIKCYWSPYQNHLELPSDADETYYGNRILELLEESVRLRMLSDVPVGVFLSGGVDSTTNVALMSKVSGGNVHTFTAGFQGQQAYDERVYARKAAKHFKTNHDEIEVTRQDLTETLPELSFYLDEPIADPTVIPIYFVSKLARQCRAIVILNGDGGDELFCGYRKWMQYLRIKPYWNVLNSLPQKLKKLLTQLGRSLGVNGTFVEFLERSSRGIELYAGPTGALKGTDAFRELLDTNRRYDIYRAVKDGFDTFVMESKSRDYVEWLSYWGLRSGVEHTYLYRADRMGMANSIEIRVPFLDHHLVEFAMQMPQYLKYKNGETKYILKKALEGVVPDVFLYRKKQGFCVPIREWAGKMMNEKIFKVLPQIHKEWSALTEGFMESMRARLLEDQRDDPNGDLTWNLYSLATWYERWFK